MILRRWRADVVRLVYKMLKVYEVGPRDGLQNEATLLSAAQKQGLIAGLVDAGLRHIEATSFVHPKACLLYTSDAADERSSVDLGGRRIL